ncbi:hypothetical protein Emag_007113 [Eimeria magna]
MPARRRRGRRARCRLGCGGWRVVRGRARVKVIVEAEGAGLLWAVFAPARICARQGVRVYREARDVLQVVEAICSTSLIAGVRGDVFWEVTKEGGDNEVLTQVRGIWLRGHAGTSVRLEARAGLLHGDMKGVSGAVQSLVRQLHGLQERAQIGVIAGISVEARQAIEDAPAPLRQVGRHGSGIHGHPAKRGGLAGGQRGVSGGPTVRSGTSGGGETPESRRVGRSGQQGAPGPRSGRKPFCIPSRGGWRGRATPFEVGRGGTCHNTPRALGARRSADRAASSNHCGG